MRHFLLAHRAPLLTGLILLLLWGLFASISPVSKGARWASRNCLIGCPF